MLVIASDGPVVEKPLTEPACKAFLAACQKISLRYRFRGGHFYYYDGVIRWSAGLGYQGDYLRNIIAAYVEAPSGSNYTAAEEELSAFYDNAEAWSQLGKYFDVAKGVLIERR